MKARESPRMRMVWGAARLMGLLTSTFSMLTIFCGGASAQSPQTSEPRGDTQVWSEVELSAQLNQRIDLLFIGELRVGRNVSRLVNERIGVGLSFNLNKYLALSPRYRYIAEQPFPGRNIRENRITLAATIRAPFRGFTFDDRNQLDLRLRSFDDRNQLDLRLRSPGSTTQYRNRLRVERPVKFKGAQFTLFASDEVFYDSRARAWIRNRFSVGAGRKFGKLTTVEIYSLWQNDRFSRRGDLRVIGMTMKIRLK